MTYCSPPLISFEQNFYFQKVLPTMPGESLKWVVHRVAKWKMKSRQVKMKWIVRSRCVDFLLYFDFWCDSVNLITFNWCIGLITFFSWRKYVFISIKPCWNIIDWSWKVMSVKWRGWRWDIQILLIIQLIWHVCVSFYNVVDVAIWFKQWEVEKKVTAPCESWPHVRSKFLRI